MGQEESELVGEPYKYPHAAADILYTSALFAQIHKVLCTLCYEFVFVINDVEFSF
jgi:hypothetical protein